MAKRSLKKWIAICHALKKIHSKNVANLPWQLYTKRKMVATICWCQKIDDNLLCCTSTKSNSNQTRQSKNTKINRLLSHDAKFMFIQKLPWQITWICCRLCAWIEINCQALCKVPTRVIYMISYGVPLPGTIMDQGICSYALSSLTIRKASSCIEDQTNYHI